jgi:hypothetical protein
MWALLFAGLDAARGDDTGMDLPPNPGTIRLVDELDPVPDGDAFCVDVRGGSTESGDLLQVHNCHLRMGSVPEDQEYTTDYPGIGNIYATQADLCVEVRGPARAGASLRVVECSASSGQVWVAGADGWIHPASDTTLCWAVENVPRTPGVPDRNTKRGLTLETCEDVSARLVTWLVPGGSIGG